MIKFNLNKEWKFIQSEVPVVNRNNYSQQKRSLLFNFQIALEAIEKENNKKIMDSLKFIYMKYKNQYTALA